VIGVTPAVRSSLSKVRHPSCSAALHSFSLRYSFPVFIASIRFALVILVCAFSVAQAQTYKYFRPGNPVDVETKAKFGIAMMGGGSDLDEAFRWLCNDGNGGDFLVLRALGDDDYNSYVNGLCMANSVATLILPSRAAAEDPAVAEIIRKAEVVFIAGGDQANYIRGWKDTPVEKAINDGIAAGKPTAPDWQWKVSSSTELSATSRTIRTWPRLTF
jgi:hypothetical protein